MFSLRSSPIMLFAAHFLASGIALPAPATAAETRIGAHFLNAALLAGTTLTQVVAPSANVNGIILQTAYLAAIGTGGCGPVATVLYAQPSTPSTAGGAIDSNARIIALVANGTADLAQFFMPYPLFIGAGSGLWAFVSAQGSSQCGSATMTYDLL